MPSVLQVVDTDVSVLFDLNGTNGPEAGSVTCELLHDPNWSAPDFSFSRFESPRGTGGSTTRVRAGLTQATLPIRFRAASYDELNTAIGRLSLLLAQGCVMRWTPNGSTEVRYADIEPTDTPVVLDGRQLAMYQATSLFDTPTGVTLRLVRQPYFRGGELDPASNVAPDPLMLKESGFNGGGALDMWTPSAGFSAHGVTDEVYHTTLTTDAIALLLGRSHVASIGDSEEWTFSFYARVTSGASDAYAQVQPRDSGGSTVGSGWGSSASATALTGSWQRFSTTGTTEASSNDFADLIVGFINGNGATVEVRWAQMELTDTPSQFRVGVMGIGNEPITDGITSHGRTVLFYNFGDAPAPVRLKVSGAATGAQLIAGRWSTGGVIDALPVLGYAGNSFAQAEDMTPGVDTAVSAAYASTSSGGGNDSQRTTFATHNNDVVTTDEERIKLTMSAAQLAAVAGGTFQIWVRVLTDNPGAYDFKLTHAFRTGDTYRIAHPRVSWAPDDPEDWYDVNLGTVAVPSDAASLILEFYAQRTSGSNNLHWDFASWVPTDEAGYYGHDDLGYTNIETDPERQRVVRVNASGDVEAYLDAHGPVPFVMPPGLSAVTLLSGLTDLAGVRFKNTNFLTDLVQFTYSPRYYA
jgi:hypothetical protein